jgi:hypothetical protein
MASPEHLDALIGQALECASEAARQLRELNLDPVDKHLHSIGRAANELWELREHLYEVFPGIKRDFVEESEVDEHRFNQLSALYNRALIAEQGDDKVEAAILFERLRTEAVFGFFKLCAEAGLYRISKAT